MEEFRDELRRTVLAFVRIRGYPLNVHVFGPQGSGKTSFIRTCFRALMGCGEDSEETQRRRKKRKGRRKKGRRRRESDGFGGESNSRGNRGNHNDSHSANDNGPAGKSDHFARDNSRHNTGSSSSSSEKLRRRKVEKDSERRKPRRSPGDHYLEKSESEIQRQTGIARGIPEMIRQLEMDLHRTDDGTSKFSVRKGCDVYFQVNLTAVQPS
jgi:hypothetical protein